MAFEWSDVGEYLGKYGGKALKVVSAVATGGAPAGIASVVSMFTEATGETDPGKALEAFKSNPELIVKMEAIESRERQNTLKHHRLMVELELDDKQKAHATTQATIQAGDKADDRLVRWTRPLQSWCSLIIAGVYSMSETIDIAVLMVWLTLPFAYAGLRQIGKGIDSKTLGKVTAAIHAGKK